MKPGLSKTAETPTDRSALERFRMDLSLVKNSLEGGGRAQEDLIARLRCVPRILCSLNGQHGAVLKESELEDLAQETVIRIWGKRAGFEGRSTLESWIYPFCHFALMNRLRKEGRRPRLVDLGSTGQMAAPPERTDYGHVHKAIEQLPDEQSVVVKAKYFDGLTFVEIGEMLDVTPSMAKRRYYRGMDRLRILLAPEEED